MGDPGTGSNTGMGLHESARIHENARMGTAWGVGSMLGCIKFDDDYPEATPLSAWPLTEAEKGVYPAQRNASFTISRPVTEEVIAARFNNFYEFSNAKDDVWKKIDRFVTRPWEIEITGLIHNPMIVDIDDLIRRMPFEERLYRLRCVEAWSMAVPWTGFPMKKLLEWVQPQSKARFVRMTTFMRPDQARAQNRKGIPWPYDEGLTIEEASNELTLLVTGIYGHPLPKQHGAPFRLIVPWKYGFKSIKSIVRIEFTDRQPATFWNTLVSHEYDFEANVNPDIPHPRWSQKTEKAIGTGTRRPTLLYNGYQEHVAHLYLRIKPLHASHPIKRWSRWNEGKRLPFESRFREC